MILARKHIHNFKYSYKLVYHHEKEHIDPSLINKDVLAPEIKNNLPLPDGLDENTVFEVLPVKKLREHEYRKGASSTYIKIEIPKGK